MKSIVTESFKIALVESFINTIKDSDSYYLQLYSPNKKPLFSIKIAPDNIIQGVKNNRITYDTIVAYNKDTPNLYKLPFWGTSETLYQHSVYKLLDSRPGKASSLPTHKTVQPVTSPDGSTWKYMYDIPPALAYKFSTPYYVPVIDESSVYLTESSNRPPNGHGYSILYELAATSIIINTKIPGSLFDKRLTYKALSILKTTSDKPIIYNSIRCVPVASGSSLNVGDRFTISEAGLILDAIVEAKMKDGTLLISGDERIIDLIARNEYKFSKGSYRLVAPDTLSSDSMALSIDDNKIKTIESKTMQTIITVIDF